MNKKADLFYEIFYTCHQHPGSTLSNEISHNTEEIKNLVDVNVFSL